MNLLPHELIIDNFAGGGGASHGIFGATGRHPDIAINHDAEALAMHRANHPTTRHLREDVFDIDPIALCAGRPVGLAWFSPDCKHFSKAKGGKPVDKRIRGLAWVVVKWAAAVKPRVICLENVEEFQTWGPLHRQHTHGCKGNHRRPKRDAGGHIIKYIDGKTTGCKAQCRLGHPIAERAGVTFRFWWKKLERLGYQLEMKELRACDHETPTIRKRLFVVARCDGMPIEWPEATNADPKSPAVKSGRLKPWRTAAECIDWSLPCPSIFERDRPLAENTLKRIARGIQRYVIDAANPFIVPVSHAGDARAHSIDEPLRTVTGAHRGEQAIVAPYVSRVDQTSGADRNGIAPPDEPLRTIHAVNPFAVISPLLAGVGGRAGQSRPRSADEPLQTITAKGDTAVVTPFLTEHANASTQRNFPADDPLRTQCGEVKGGHFAVVAPVISTYYGEKSPDEVRGNSVDAPLHTQTTENRHAVVAPYLIPRYGERDGQEPRCASVENPASTIVPTANGGQLVSAIMVGAGGPERAGEPREVDQPNITQMARNHQQLVTAFLAQHNGGPRNEGTTGREAEAPLSTITHRGTQQQVVATHLARHTKNTVGSGVDDPVNTVMTREKDSLVTSHLLKLKGTCQDGQPTDEPAPTVQAGGLHIGDVRAFLIKYYGNEREGINPKEPAHTVTSKDRIGLVTVHGIEYQIVDIGMRMLQPRELYRAQGFGDSYIIEWGIDEDGNKITLSKTAQVRMCGNSVCPPLAEAIVRTLLATSGKSESRTNRPAKQMGLL